MSLIGFGLDVPTPAGVMAVNPSAAACGSVTGTKQMLADLGYNPGAVDSNLASIPFQKAVVQFAQERGIPVHGQLGPSICGPLAQAWQQQQAAAASAGQAGQAAAAAAAAAAASPSNVQQKEGGMSTTTMILIGAAAVVGIGAIIYLKKK